jgi:hypothetical protein
MDIQIFFLYTQCISLSWASLMRWQPGFVSLSDNRVLGLRLHSSLKSTVSLALVAHTCNPSYSEGRDQKDCQLRQTVQETLILKKNIFHKKGLEVWLKV